MLPNLNELVLNLERLHEVIAEVINLVTRLLDSEKAGVMLYNEETNELVLQKPAFNLDDDSVNLYRVSLKAGEMQLKSIQPGCHILHVTHGVTPAFCKGSSCSQVL